MEKIMDFLAENYIWFFVVAGILCFALIGFIIESRKKHKNDFKGESIEEKQDVFNNTPLDIAPSEPTALDVNTNKNTINSTNNNEVVENLSFDNTDTMEINDIPLVNENSKPQPIEFYSGPFQMPTEENKQSFSSNNSVIREEVSSAVSTDANFSASIGNPISYEQVSSNSQNNVNNNLNVNDTRDSSQNIDIFNDFK